MADINEILGRNINSVKELKDAIKELQNSLIGVDTESEQFKTTSQQLAAAQDELAKVTRAGKDANDAAKDSIVGLQQEYKALYDQYKLLSEEQRNSDFGKGMAESLSTLSEKINASKKEVGNFTSNIGHYAEGATEAFNKLGISAGGLQKPLSLASTGAKGFNTALKTLSANPIILVITALVAILVKAAEAIKKNEELSNRLKVAFSTFKPVLDLVANAFDFLAGIIVKVVEGLAKVAEKIMSVIPGMKQAVQSHKDLAKATNDLTKAQREANVENSKKQATVENLRAEAAAAEDATEKQRLLEEAKALQAEIDQKNIELAQEELRIMEEYAAKTANSAEENEKLAAAQQKVNDAIAQGERNQRMYNKQLAQTTKTTKGATSASKDYAKEAKELNARLIEDNKDEITKLTEKYREEKKLLEKYHYDTKLLTKKYSEDIAAINKAIWKNEREAYKNAFDSWTDDLSRWYENRKQLAITKTEAIFLDVNKLQDAKEKLERFKTETEAIVGNAQDAFGKMMNTIFEHADLSKITDIAYVGDILERYTDEADLESVKKIFYGYGEESWVAFTEGLEDDAKELNNTFGLNIKNTTDLEARAVQLGKDIAQKYGEAVIESLEEWKTEADAGLYEILYDVLKIDDSPAATEWAKEFIAKTEYVQLEEERRALEEELAVFSGTTEQKLQIMQRYYEIVAELREKDQALADLSSQRSLEMVNNLVDTTDQLGSALSTMSSTWTSVVDSEVKAGKISEAEAKNRKRRYLEMEKIATAFNIATILGDLASGSFSIWKGYAEEVGKVNPQTAAAAGPGAAVSLAALNTKSLISAIARQTSLAATATAQIAAARGKYVASKNNFDAEQGGSTSIGVAATPIPIDSSPYSYTRTVQTAEEQEELNRPIVCSIVDIEDALDVRKVRVVESSF